MKGNTSVFLQEKGNLSHTAPALQWTCLAEKEQHKEASPFSSPSNIHTRRPDCQVHSP